MWHLSFFTSLLWYPGIEYLGLYNTSPSAYSFYITILFWTIFCCTPFWFRSPKTGFGDPVTSPLILAKFAVVPAFVSLLLYPVKIRVVYRFGILVWTLRYFLGIYHTDTEGKLGQYFRYFKIGGSPLFPKEGGGLRPPFVHFALLLRDKRNSRQIFKKRVPAKSSKGVPAKSYIKNTQLWDFGKIVIPIPKYRPNSASNLPIPARGGVKKRYTTLVYIKEDYRTILVST